MSAEFPDSPEADAFGLGIPVQEVGHGPPTVLRSERQPLMGWLAVSVFGHGSALVVGLIVALIGHTCNPRKPLVDPKEAMEVSMVVLPKSATKMPDRATRAPVPKGQDIPDAPAPDLPPPVKQSDLVLKTDTPEPAPKGVSDDERREHMMEEMERQRLLDELMDAADGPVDRNATDPNSTSDEMINAIGTAARGDPEFARYVAQVQQIFMQHFKPLAAISAANPNLVTKVLIQVDESGRILAWEVSGPSGVAAFDAAAERAVTEVGTIPPPPPKYAALAAAGYEVNFRAP